MVSLRSLWFPLASGGALFVVWVVARLGGGGFLPSALFTLALPLLFEAGTWFGAAKVGRLYYDMDERVIHSEAYDPRAVLVRYVVICALLFSILIAREAEVLPSGFGKWLTLILIGLLWLAFVIRSYGQQIRALARRKNVPLSAARDNQG